MRILGLLCYSISTTLFRTQFDATYQLELMETTYWACELTLASKVSAHYNKAKLLMPRN